MSDLFGTTDCGNQKKYITGWGNKAFYMFRVLRTNPRVAFSFAEDTF